jgi:alkanesulfonate monooxygenase SsuD/methylene tetrahydromethanopterin reductase-like flavin-dependent oxidoreductase (luciferase family)/putative sterol carrier protein
MRFGLFYEHQLPRPWAEGAEEILLRNALEQVELADRIGIDFVWEVEHHFLEEYSHSSAPEVFLAAASQRTRRIRLGHGIVQLPPAFNHPVRIAERISTLDLISGGRVEFGTGEASSEMELGGFGVPRGDKRAQWEEALDAITRMFVEEPFAGYEGDYVSIPQRNVVPKPRQKPHPPLWAACSRRETILLAARKGLGALSFSFVEPEDAKEWVDDYYRLIASADCVPAGFSVNPNFAVTVPFMCHEDEATAIERGIDGGHFFGYSLGHYYVYGRHRPGRTSLWDEFERHRHEHGFARDIINARGDSLGIRLLEAGLGSMRGAIGTPDQIAELASRYEAAGVDQIILVAQSGNNAHEHVCDSLELFGKEVLPRFAPDGAAKEQEKAERLEQASRAALERRAPARSADSSYLVTSQGEKEPARVPVLSPRQEPEASPEDVFLESLRGRSDADLTELARTTPTLELIFGGMAESFVPEEAGGFSGDIAYELTDGNDTYEWTVTVDGSEARVSPVGSPSPALVVRTDVCTFLRIVSGEDNGALAMIQGRVRLEGDPKVALNLGAMFGRSQY